MDCSFLCELETKRMKQIDGIVLVIMLVVQQATSSPPMPPGFHVRACCVDSRLLMSTVRNETNYVLSMDGLAVDLMAWLGAKYNLTYECVPQVPRTMENSSNQVGAIYYLETGVCDVVWGIGVIRHDRYQHIDFVHPYMVDSAALLIPRPSKSFQQLWGIWQPFQPEVWVLMLISYLVINIFIGTDQLRSGGRSGASLPWIVALGYLLIYRDHASSKFKIRLILAARGFAVFVLANAYHPEMISFIMHPSYQSLADSPRDLASKEGVFPVVIRGLISDVTISNSDDPVMRQLAVKLDSDPRLRCKDVQSGIELVKQGSYVFIDNLSRIMPALLSNFKVNKQCSLSLAKNDLANYLLAWGVPKHAQYLEAFNRGMLRMMEIGLMQQWQKRYGIQSYKCFNQITSRKKLDESRLLIKLSLNGLTGIFLALFIGYTIALLALFVEKVAIKFVDSRVPSTRAAAS